MQAKLTAWSCALVVLTLPLTASASNASLEIEYVAPIGPFNGLEYAYFEGSLRGEVTRADATTGTYVAPVVVIYPVSNGNGVGVVEWVNNAGYGLLDAEGNSVVCPRGDELCEEGEVAGHRNLRFVAPFARIMLEDYMFDNGYTYMAIQWAKLVTDSLGPIPLDGTQRRRLAYGMIEQADDGREILTDAASFLRSPEAVEGLDAPPILPSETIISAGFSIAAALQRTWLASGFNQSDSGPVYDGFLNLVPGSMCVTFAGNGLDITPCPGPPAAGDVKVLSLQTQSDPEFFAGAFARDLEGAVPNYRTWELAGVSHLPAPVFDVSFLGSTTQNPITSRPVGRSALYHLTEWIVNGTEPPPSIYIEGSLDKMFNWTTTLDEDGNAVGGLRLPHMTRTLEGGETVGAPTGIYYGVNLEELMSEQVNPVIVLGGGYEPFDAAELSERYPTKEDYQELVTAAADQLLEEGYILQIDRDWYASGRAIPPEIPDEPDPEEPQDDGDGCSTAGRGADTASLLFVALVLLLTAARGRRRLPSDRR